MCSSGLESLPTAYLRMEEVPVSLKIRSLPYSKGHMVLSTHYMAILPVTTIFSAQSQGR